MIGTGEAAFVVLAGGSGRRLGAGRNKVYLPLAGRPVLSWSLDWAAEVAEVGPVVLVIRPEDADEAGRAVAASRAPGPVEVVAGGDTRHGSELAAFDLLADRVAAGAVRVVAVHDGARPLAGAELLRRVVREAARGGGAVPTVPVRAVWRLDGGLLRPPATPLHGVQTPQAFRAAPLLEAYAASRRTGVEGTDTASMLEHHGGPPVTAVPGSPDNLKVTYAADLPRAERLLATAVSGRPPAHRG